MQHHPSYSFDLVRHLVVREFHLRYRRSVFGWLWAIGQPLARLLVLSFVFTRIIDLDVPNYPVFLFTGLIAWSWFSQGVQSATTSVVDRRDLLHRPGVPRSVIPVVAVLSDGLDYIASLPVLAAFVLFSGGIPATALALPLFVIPQVLLTIGIGFALCSANVFVRDVKQVVVVAVLLGFYVTPILYKRRTHSRELPMGGRSQPRRPSGRRAARCPDRGHHAVARRTGPRVDRRARRPGDRHADLPGYQPSVRGRAVTRG